MKILEFLFLGILYIFSMRSSDVQFGQLRIGQTVTKLPSKFSEIVGSCEKGQDGYYFDCSLVDNNGFKYSIYEGLVISIKAKLESAPYFSTMCVYAYFDVALACALKSNGLIYAGVAKESGGDNVVIVDATKPFRCFEPCTLVTRFKASGEIVGITLKTASPHL